MTSFMKKLVMYLNMNFAVFSVWQIWVEGPSGEVDYVTDSSTL